MDINSSSFYPSTKIRLNLPANCLPGDEQYYVQMLEGEVRACQVLKFENVLANRELVNEETYKLSLSNLSSAIEVLEDRDAAVCR